MAKGKKEKKQKYSNEKYRSVADIVITTNWIKALWTDFLRPYGISTQQFNILRILRTAGDWMAMSDVKEQMMEKAPNATRLADKLLEKKLIKRNRSKEDRRVVFVHITEQGLKLLKITDEKEEGKHVEFMGRISQNEAIMISSILNKMRG